MRPVTSACALMVFQLWNCGAASILTIFSMKAAGSIGANSPLRLRLLVMTWATPRPISPSAGDPATKFGIAIGSGATLPSVTCNLVCATARDGSSKPAAAPPIRTSRLESGNGGNENDVTGIVGSFFKNVSCETWSWGQNRCPYISTAQRFRRAAWYRADPARLREPRLPRRPDIAPSCRLRPPEAAPPGVDPHSAGSEP